jgi:predicted Zn-dependent protease
MQESSGQSLPSFLSTHPDPGDRERRVHQLAVEWQGNVAYRPLNRTRYDYLRRIDGIVYGPDPRQGFVENNTFYHPQMKFRFPVPAEWTVNNSASTVLIIEPDEAAYIQLTLGRAETAAATADAFIKNSGVEVVSRGAKKIHGFAAVVVVSNLTTDDGILRVVSYFIEKAPGVYEFHGITAAADFGKYEKSFREVMEGFREVTDPAALNKQPQRLRIAQAPSSGTMRSALQALGVESGMHDELSILNGLKPDEPVEKGYWIKIVE